jgi:hypothetical protein
MYFLRHSKDGALCMSIVIRSLIGTAALAVASSGASGVSADGGIGSSLQSDFGKSFFQENINFKDGSGDVLTKGGVRFGPGRDRGANWAALDPDDSYFEVLGFYLEGMESGSEGYRPARAGSAFALNDVPRSPGISSVKYVNVTGDTLLKENFNLDRGTSEGWGLNGKIVGTLPEPGTLLLMGLGLLGLGLARRRAARRAV